MSEEQREVTLGELERLDRAGNVNMSQVKVEGICTIFRADGSIKGKMRVCSVEEAEELAAAAASS